ncbi:hypothetical protein Tco_1121886 [Tanacetum coccineum]|uniref:Reverse transcriptase n=1 Tax=Tanacetum coccineum TaxID=301880 RepID=A0ABQ5IYZ7_9ASTR
MVEPKKPLRERLIHGLMKKLLQSYKLNLMRKLRLRLIMNWSKLQAKTERVNRLVEGSSKREGEELEQESSKKQKMDNDKEIAELKSLMEVIPDEEEVTIDAIPLAVKSPSIVDWKIHKEGKKSYYQIIRADGSLKMYLVFSHMLKRFDRKDLETLYKLVKAKYRSIRPVEDLDLVLYGDLKIMFEPHVEDNGRIVGIKRLTDDLRGTVAQLKEFDLLKWDPKRGILLLGQHNILCNNKTTTGSFFEPYLITRKECDNKKEDEQSQMKRKYSNTSESIDEQPNKRMYKAEKFKVIQYSLGPNEEYIAIRRCEYDIWERNKDNMSKIYQDIFQKKKTTDGR